VLLLKRLGYCNGEVGVAVVILAVGGGADLGVDVGIGVGQGDIHAQNGLAEADAPVLVVITAALGVGQAVGGGEGHVVGQAVFIADPGVGRVNTGFHAVLVAEGEAIGGDARDDFVAVPLAGLRIGVLGQLDVGRDVVGEAVAIADVVVDFDVGATGVAGEGPVIDVGGPHAGIQAAFMGDIQAALDGCFTGGLRLAAPDVVAGQGDGHADIEFAQRAFDGFGGGEAGHG